MVAAAPPAPAVNQPTLNTAVLQPVNLGPMHRGNAGLGQFQQQQNVLKQLKPEDWVGDLAPQAQTTFVNSRNAYQAGAGLLGMRSWRSVWLNQLKEPKRTLVDMDFIKMLLQNKEQYINPQLERAAKQQNLREAKMMIQAIRVRGITDQEMLDMVNEQEDRIDAQMKDFQ
jgi:hypothetical protein